MENPYHLLKGS